MSVIVTLRIKADGSKLKAWADANQDALQGIVKNAERHGLIAHRFYTNGNGEVMVLDEWPDAASFQAFFSASEADIAPIMQASGAQGPPEVNFWDELDTGDQYGWGA